jgi:hypothetical protein
MLASERLREVAECRDVSHRTAQGLARGFVRFLSLQVPGIVAAMPPAPVVADGMDGKLAKHRVAGRECLEEAGHRHRVGAGFSRGDPGPWVGVLVVGRVRL